MPYIQPRLLPSSCLPPSLPVSHLHFPPMDVQAQHLSHAFRFTEGATVLFDEFGGCAPAGVPDTTTLLSDFPRSELTSSYYGFEPRKRARVSDAFLDDQRVALPPAAVVKWRTVQVPAGDDATCGALASTSGRAASATGVPGGLILSRLYNQGAEIDVLVRLESERMRAGLEEARRRHAGALLAAAERAASGRLRAAEAELERALRRNAELEDKARQMTAECQAWTGVARSHEAVASGLRATLDQLLQSSPCVAEGDAEDARSCCFEAADGHDDGAAPRSRAAAPSCKACGGGEACVLLLPCRHLCLCAACEAAVDACPVCTAAKNDSLHVLLS